MNVETIHAERAPKAIGPYSQALRYSDFIFTSGQLPLVPETGKLIEGGIEEQTRQSLLNLRAILKKGGTDFDTVLKTTVLLSDMNDFAAMNKVYAQFFTESFPARSAVQVARLPMDAMVEIEAVAYRSDENEVG